MKADGVNPHRLFEGGESPWNDAIGPFYDETTLKEFCYKGPEIIGQDLIYTEINAEKFYPHGQFYLDDLFVMRAIPQVINVWNQFFRPAIAEGYAEVWMSMTFLLGKNPAGLSRAEILANPNSTQEQLHEVEQSVKRTLAAWKHGTTFS